MKYEVFPIVFPSFEERRGMSVKEAAEFCGRFVQVVPQRLSMLAGLTDMAWLWSGRPLDLNDDSFSNFCAWVESHELWVLRSGAERTDRLIVLDPAKRKELEQVFRESRSEPAWEFTEIGRSVAIDVGIAMAEYLRIRNPCAAWTFEDRRSDLEYGNPCVGWFGAGDSSLVATLQCGVALSHARRSNRPVAEELHSTIAWLDRQARTAGPRVKWKR